MKEIKVFLQRLDRSIKTFKVSNKPYFTFKRGHYELPVEAVNLSQSKKGVNPTPEVVYIEGYPLPITDNEEKDKDEAGRTLDDNLMENMIDQLAKPSWSFPALDFIKNISPSQILVFFFVGIIAYALISELLLI